MRLVCSGSGEHGGDQGMARARHATSNCSSCCRYGTPKLPAPHGHPHASTIQAKLCIRSYRSKAERPAIHVRLMQHLPESGQQLPLPVHLWWHLGAEKESPASRSEVHQACSFISRKHASQTPRCRVWNQPKLRESFLVRRQPSRNHPPSHSPPGVTKIMGLGCP